jgi:D-3-phosphoglycerate dehydrogenase
MSTTGDSPINVLLTDQMISSRLGVAEAIDARPELARLRVDVASDAMVGQPADLVPFLPEVEVLVTAYSRLDEDFFSHAPNLKLVIKGGIGTETIDSDAAERHGVTVTCTPGVNVHSVVEYTLGAILMSIREYATLDQEVRAGRWRETRSRYAGELRELRDCRLGIIGFGGIGSELARMALALGMEVVACDPVRALDPQPMPGVERVELDTLLSTSDFVSLNAIFTAATTGMIGAREFALMKPDAVFINAARGGLADSRALAAALEKGQLAGAFIDVQEDEPPHPDHPLLSRSDVVLTPHLGGSTRRGYESIGIEVANQISTYLAGDDQDPGVIVVQGEPSRHRAGVTTNEGSR